MIIESLNSMDNNLSLVKAVAFDFDGVFTNNHVMIDINGNEFVTCNRYDGYGIAALKLLGIEICVITSETVPLATARCKKLGLELFEGCGNKLETLTLWLKRCKVEIAHVAYLGNDINDLACIRSVGFPFCPVDAHKSVKPYSRVLKNGGGKGVVRELCDMIVETKGIA